jgi:hypothetical protein
MKLDDQIHTKIGYAVLGLLISSIAGQEQVQAAPAENPPEMNDSMIRKSQVEGTINVVMGKGAKTDYLTRCKAAQALGAELAEDEVNTLYLLLGRKVGEDELPEGQLNGLKDVVAALLDNQKALPASYPDTLMTMYKDRSYDPVWRDYCIQHLGAVCSSIKDDQKLQEVKEVCWKATEETDGGIAGTALITLSKNMKTLGIEKPTLATRAFEILTDPKSGEASKITALQICAQLGEKRALPIARQLFGADASIPMKLSAIAAIGALGDASDLPALKPYQTGRDSRLRPAVNAAIKRIEGRTTQMTGDQI